MKKNTHLHELFAHITPMFKQGSTPWNLQQEFSCKQGQKKS